MSEKRFVLDKLYYTIMTPIEKISIGRNYMTYGEVVDLLNEQHETIKQLKKENEYLHKYNTKLQKQPLLFDVQTIPDTMEIMEANTKLEKENEQLRHEIEIEKKWQLEKSQYYIKIKEENEMLKSENKKLHCINDQLEERLENSGIGIVLKMDCGNNE